MSHHRPAAQSAHDEAYDKQYEEDKEQNFGHARRHAGKTKEAEIARDNCKHEEN